MVLRDFKVRHKQTILGYLWIVLQPLALMTLYTVFFSYIVKIPSEGIPYPIFLLSALVPWRFYSATISIGASSITRAAGVLKQVYFPRLYLPISGVIVGAINALAAFIVLLVVMHYFHVSVQLKILVVPLLFLLLATLGLAVSLIAASLNTYIRDISQTIPLLIQAWMYASPVVYPISAIPERLRDIYSLNPMVGIIHAFRWATVGSNTPPWPYLMTSIFISLTLLFLGLLMFRRFERNFVDAI